MGARRWTCGPLEHKWLQSEAADVPAAALRFFALCCGGLRSLRGLRSRRGLSCTAGGRRLACRSGCSAVLSGAPGALLVLLLYATDCRFTSLVEVAPAKHRNSIEAGL
mmetsp:Transcript_110313/g.351861  ORF Transcript_110313/g.351861 Transcript_110313/m.351861 type:complete len:108 (-) Transcript_110313:1186-1509(-)